MGLAAMRIFVSESSFDLGGGLVVDDVELETEGDLAVRLVDVVRVNAMAVPLPRPVSYRVLQHELQLLLSFLLDEAGHPLVMRRAEFKASSSHIQRFVTESLGLGMLTAAVESYFGWPVDERSLAHFDVLPTNLAGRYPSSGVRPDLLFNFNGAGMPWWLAGEARGRYSKQPKGNSISAKQRQRLDDIVRWSGRNDRHPVTMTWAYSGSGQVHVDLFRVRLPQEYPPAHPSQPPAPSDGPRGLLTGFHYQEDLPPSAVVGRAEKNAQAVINQLYLSAPAPRESRSIFDAIVRGDWVTANLVAPSNLHFLLGVLDRYLPAEALSAIRLRAAATSPSGYDQSPIDINASGRILVVIARGITAPPAWSEIIRVLQ
jgi:hypothetical protein